ncbi:MAG: DUF1080 domain-containing protein [Verrucomicrobia bacterium]|nr:DUF1080 domain-containing protein [Verrucomicrobiota bacterium]
MKSILALLIGLACISAASAAEFQSLFNGKDLTGWHIMNDVTAEVVDGNLRIVKGMGWLRSDKEYGDFVFECEWRALEEKYDSGFYLRAGMEGKPWPTDTWQVNLRFDMVGALCGHGKLTPSAPTVPVNEWVKSRIEAKGRKLKLSVNGQKTWEYDGYDRVKGYLGIQVENRAFDFRNLRIRPLR